MKIIYKILIFQGLLGLILSLCYILYLMGLELIADFILGILVVLFFIVLIMILWSWTEKIYKTINNYFHKPEK